MGNEWIPASWNVTFDSGRAKYIWAEAIGGSSSNIFLNLDIVLNLGTITEPPTLAPRKKPLPGPRKSPLQVWYYIDWNSFTCVTDGETTEWAPSRKKKKIAAIFTWLTTLQCACVVNKNWCDHHIECNNISCLKYAGIIDDGAADTEMSIYYSLKHVGRSARLIELIHATLKYTT